MPEVFEPLWLTPLWLWPVPLVFELLLFEPLVPLEVPVLLPAAPLLFEPEPVVDLFEPLVPVEPDVDVPVEPDVPVLFWFWYVPVFEPLERELEPDEFQSFVMVELLVLLPLCEPVR